jgi:hypothetical protein
VRARAHRCASRRGGCRVLGRDRALGAGAIAGTRELATVAIVLACRDTDALPPGDPRWPAIARRIRAMPSRAGRDASLLDAIGLRCGADVAFAIGGAVVPGRALTRPRSRGRPGDGGGQPAIARVVVVPSACTSTSELRGSMSQPGSSLSGSLLTSTQPRPRSGAIMRQVPPVHT